MRVRCERLGVVLSPNGDPREADGVLNPGAVRDRADRLVLYPRVVAAGNVSRIGILRFERDGTPIRLGYALEPERDYERRTSPGGYGCEDARVTYLPVLDRYVMTYTAFGPRGARIAIAVSDDAYAWTRLGLVSFADARLNEVDNKDAAFFPEPVRSPSGKPSLAFFHRPMRAETINGQTPIPVVLALPPERREVAHLAYVLLDAALRDVAALCEPAESVRVLPVGEAWGTFKNGAGTPPVRTAFGWLSLFHGVDVVQRDAIPSLFYSAGVLVNDLEQPHLVRYRSPQPVLQPQTGAERFGTVNDVVFPTGIDRIGHDAYDVYYGGADAAILRARLEIEP